MVAVQVCDEELPHVAQAVADGVQRLRQQLLGVRQRPSTVDEDDLGPVRDRVDVHCLQPVVGQR